MYTCCLECFLSTQTLLWLVPMHIQVMACGGGRGGSGGVWRGRVERYDGCGAVVVGRQVWWV